MADTATGIPNVRVIAELDGTATTTSATTTTDHNGDFSFESLAPGRYRVTLEYRPHPRQGPVQHFVDVKAGTTAKLDAPVMPRKPREDRSNMPMPYGAPPARVRVV